MTTHTTLATLQENLAAADRATLQQWIAQYRELVVNAPNADRRRNLKVILEMIRDETHNRGSGYPYTGATGQPVWACCESTIGPVCKHRS